MFPPEKLIFTYPFEQENRWSLKTGKSFFYKIRNLLRGQTFKLP